MTNGFMYHSLRTEENKDTKIIKLLKYNDIIANIFILIYSIHKTPDLSNYAVFGSINFLINKYANHYLYNDLSQYLSQYHLNYNNSLKAYTIHDIMHVGFIQLPLAIGLEKILKII